MPKGDAYIPLSKYLKESNGELIKLSFQEIETILQKKLPKSAYKHSQPWWSNDYSHSQAIAWLDAGYETNLVSDTISENYIVFVKKSSIV